MNIIPAPDDALSAVNPAPGNYYVAVMDGGRTSLLLGPFRNHEEAIAQVIPVRNFVHEADPRSVFYQFGTMLMTEEYTAPGRLNGFFPDMALPIDQTAPSPGKKPKKTVASYHY